MRFDDIPMFARNWSKYWAERLTQPPRAIAWDLT
jgi:hypothetical protein